jgi:hypothetical protein
MYFEQQSVNEELQNVLFTVQSLLKSPHSSCIGLMVWQESPSRKEKKTFYCSESIAKKALECNPQGGRRMATTLVQMSNNVDKESKVPYTGDNETREQTSPSTP